MVFYGFVLVVLALLGRSAYRDYKHLKERAAIEEAECREVPGDYLIEAIQERWELACKTDPVQQWLDDAERAWPSRAERAWKPLRDSVRTPIAVGQVWVNASGLAFRITGILAKGSDRDRDVVNKLWEDGDKTEGSRADHHTRYKLAIAAPASLDVRTRRAVNRLQMHGTMTEAQFLYLAEARR